MRLAKLEPLIVEPVMDGRDIGSFMDEIHKSENSIVTPISAANKATDPPIQRQHEEIKKAFVRLTDFIKSREEKKPASSGHQTRKALAIRTYALVIEPNLRARSLGTHIYRAA
jgi:hypothetical protein